MRVPLTVKIGYTAFMLVLVPCYWVLYGPTNFLYFCDVALFFTLAAVWTENPLWVSMPAVGILLPQAFWMVDFLSTAAGHPLFGMTNYMFDAQNPLFNRALSFFHFWLPILIVYLLKKLGYDRRAFVAWWGVAIVVLLIGYFLLPAPPAPADNPLLPVNVNYVYGLGDKPQSWMHPHLYFLLVFTVLPVVVYAPTHFALRRLFPRSEAAGQLPNGL
ncbi:MAG TPA: hypothetical protein VF950_17460 [Planctomycetota bacterium]